MNATAWRVALLLVMPRAVSAQVEGVLSRLDTVAMRSHLERLAHDSMEGRAPGTRGGRRAAEYIARQFRGWGLEPAGDSGGYFHHFGYAIVRNRRSVIRVGSESLETGSEQVGTVMGTASRLRVRGTAVFLGYGASLPGRDDFRNADLEGKIAIVLAGGPEAGDGASRSVKTARAAQRGAVATLVIHREDFAGFPWREIPDYWGEGHLATEAAGQAGRRAGTGSFWVSAAGAGRLLKGTGYSVDRLVALANGAEGAIPLDITLELELDNEVERVAARNVAGLVRGAGPLAEDVVVIGAHYDHLGIGFPVAGDSIYNGAQDNAAGTAQLLALAQAWAGAPLKPARSILFLAFDAEEPGYIGSEAWVRHPGVPLERQVAMINLDAANLHGQTRDASALGLKQSSLEAHFRKAAGEEGLRVPESLPDSIEAFFLRSDQLPFARAGVPATFIFLGWDFVGRTPEWTMTQWNRYFQDRYHRPSDEYHPGFSMAGALQQARVVTRLAWGVAQAPDRPTWRAGQEP